MLPNYEGLLRLLVAHVRLWLRDAQHDEAELAEIAAWLNITPGALYRLINGQQNPFEESGFYRHCPGCGKALPEHNEGTRGSGRKRQYCNDRCRLLAAKLRKDTVHVT